MPRILLVDDDPAVLRSTAAVLRHHGFEVDCHASVRSALSSLERNRPEVLVTDLHLNDESGLELLREASAGELAAIVITGQPDVASAIDALRLSAVDYVLKPLDPLDLVARVRVAAEKARARRRVSDARRELDSITGMLEAVREVLDAPGAVEIGGAKTSKRPVAGLPGLSPEERALLSGRELEILELTASGKSAKEIASMLFISHHTVRNHVRSIYSKLDVHSQIELVRKVVG